MASLKLNVTGQLNNLIPVSGNTYRFIVRYYSTSDVLLPNSQLTQNAEVMTTLTNNTFDLNFPIADGSYSINNVKVKLYNNSTTGDCFAEFVTNIAVSCTTGGTGACNPFVVLTGTPTQVCTGNTVTINGSNLVSTGGTPPYQYALVKAADFTTLQNLSWGTSKTWTGAIPNTPYRIYTRGTNIVNDSSCYSFISLTTSNCEVATTCSPAITLTGNVTQSCFNTTNAILNGSGLTATGGNGSYLYAIVKANEFTNVGALNFAAAKTWTVAQNTNYRIYVKDTSGINDTSCYAFVTVTSRDCDDSTTNDCLSGPTLLNINYFSPTSLTFAFSGLEVYSIAWRIKDGGTVIRSGIAAPTSANVTIDYATLDEGTYTLEIEGDNCNSDVTTKTFTLIDDVIVEPGDTNYKLITKGMDEHMRITRRVEGDIEYITDNTANDLQGGYEYRYIIGAQVIKRSTPLNEYPVARNNGFRVAKFNTKIGLDSLNRWPGQGEPGEGYYDSNAAQSFVHNVSAAVESGVFTGNQSGFKNHIPANYDPTLAMPQWADIMPNLQLPQGRVFILKGVGVWTIPQMLQKGITHISHYELPRPNGDESQAAALKLQGITYNDVPTSFQIFGNPLPSNPSDEQVDALISRHNLTDAIWINETQEQAHAIPPESMWLRRFYAGIANIHQNLFRSKGITSYICHNYFQFWPNAYHLGQVSADVSKNNFRIPLDQLQHTNFSPGGSLSTTNLIVEAVYLGAPDIQQNQIYDLAYKLLLFRRMGYQSGVFLAGEHEWRPNNMFLTDYPDGKYYSKGKIPLDPNVLITSVLWSQIYGRVFVQWGGGGKSPSKTWNRFTFEPTYWKANGSNDYKTSSPNPNYNGGANGDVFPYQSHPDFPHMISGGIGYYGYNGNTDLCRFALQVFAETWGTIPEDGERRYLSYRIDGGSWIEAVNQQEDDLVNASVAQRGFVDSISKNGRIAWHYTNGFADNNWHTLDVRFPNGRVVTNRISGNGTHIKVEDL